jgi:hypothetical protein
LDGPLPKLCRAVALSRQDGRHSAVALLLKAALIQVSDYRLLGASGIVLHPYMVIFISWHSNTMIAWSDFNFVPIQKSISFLVFQ